MNKPALLTLAATVFLGPTLYASQAAICKTNGMELRRNLSPERYAEVCKDIPEPPQLQPRQPLGSDPKVSMLCEEKNYDKYTPEERAVVDAYCVSFAEANDPMLQAIMDVRCDPAVLPTLTEPERKEVDCGKPIFLRDLHPLCRDYLIGKVWFDETARKEYCPMAPPILKTNAQLILVRR